MFFLGNALIDFNEFCTLMQNYSSDNMEAEIREAFKLFDADGSGKISTDEIRQVKVFGIVGAVQPVFQKKLNMNLLSINAN